MIIQAPQLGESLYFNYEKTFSIVLMALIYARYRFGAMDIRAYERNSDGGVLSELLMGQNLEEDKFNVLGYKPLLGKNGAMPHVVIADEAFPLKRYILRPYSGTQLVEASKVFNYRLSRAQRIVENAFGIFAVRWRI